MATLVSPVRAAVATASAPARLLAATRGVLVSAFSALGLALGSIFFIPQAWVGLVLWLALLLDLRRAALVVMGLAIGVAVKRALRVSDRPGLGGGVKANALLAAVVTGWMTGPLPMSWSEQFLLAGAAAVAAGLVAAAVMRVLSQSVLPALLWGYCLVAAMLFTICPQCTTAAANMMPAWPPPRDAQEWVMSFLRSMGSLMYSADPLVGVLVVLAILLWSRAMFICGVVGWISGVIVALGFQNLHLFYDWRPLSYNYFIAGMALGAVVFVPGRASLLIAAMAGAGTSFFGLALQYGLSWSAPSYLPVSSALAIWVGIAALTLAGDRSRFWRNTTEDLPPEEGWWRLAYLAERFGGYTPLFAVPVAGELRIAQGFSGQLSHKGLFRHALDFQRPHSAEAAAGSIWGAVVTSPVSGTVERIRNIVPDNAPGVCNYAEPWGNYVVIRLDAGGWALLGHLQQGTVAVAIGARVETGAYLGRVGNSGRSSVPHLHMHLQAGPEPGTPTRMFRLANYLCAAKADGPLRTWKAAAIPAEREAVMAADRNTPVYLTLVGISPGSAVWAVESTGHVPRAFRPRGTGRQTQRVDVLLDSLGQYVFDAGPEGKLVIRLDPDGWRVADLSQVTSPFLKLLALAAPCVPHAAKAGLAWNDLAPAMRAGGFLRQITLILAPYWRRRFTQVDCACVSEPGPVGQPFEIVSHPKARSAALPSKVTCQFAAYRGPVKVRADFKRGCVTFTLLSYEPGARSNGASGVARD